MKLVKISNFIQFFKSKFAQLSLFLTFEQFLMFFTTKENFFKGYFWQICLSWIRIRIFKADGSDFFRAPLTFKIALRPCAHGKSQRFGTGYEFFAGSRPKDPDLKTGKVNFKKLPVFFGTGVLTQFDTTWSVQFFFSSKSALLCISNAVYLNRILEVEISVLSRSLNL